MIEITGVKDIVEKEKEVEKVSSETLEENSVKETSEEVSEEDSTDETSEGISTDASEEEKDYAKNTRKHYATCLLIVLVESIILAFIFGYFLTRGKSTDTEDISSISASDTEDIEFNNAELEDKDVDWIFDTELYRDDKYFDDLYKKGGSIYEIATDIIGASNTLSKRVSVLNKVEVSTCFNGIDYLREKYGKEYLEDRALIFKKHETIKVDDKILMRYLLQDFNTHEINELRAVVSLKNGKESIEYSDTLLNKEVENVVEAELRESFANGYETQNLVVNEINFNLNETFGKEFKTVDEIVGHIKTNKEDNENQLEVYVDGSAEFSRRGFEVYHTYNKDGYTKDGIYAAAIESVTNNYFKNTDLKIAIDEKDRKTEYTVKMK